jgi:hypothetical protein
VVAEKEKPQIHHKQLEQPELLAKDLPAEVVAQLVVVVAVVAEPVKLDSIMMETLVETVVQEYCQL